MKYLRNIANIILENTEKEYKYIARNKCGLLCLFTRKPEKLKEEGFWGYKEGHSVSFFGFRHLFRWIKWKDEEPYKFR